MSIILEYDILSVELLNPEFSDLETMELLRSENTMRRKNATVFAESIWPKTLTYNVTAYINECKLLFKDFITFLIASAGQIVHCTYLRNDSVTGIRKEFDCIVMISGNTEYREVSPGYWEVPLVLIEV